MVPISNEWRPMPVMLRHHLFDRQACYFYNNGAIDGGWKRVALYPSAFQTDALLRELSSH